MLVLIYIYIYNIKPKIGLEVKITNGVFWVPPLHPFDKITHGFENQKLLAEVLIAIS